jgi:hypothetical protein
MSRLIRYRGHIYDVGTSNKSFLQVSADLRTLGIKNCYFMLEVIDPQVILIDPFKKNKDGTTALTKDQITRVLTECKRNPWYFLREVVRITAPGNIDGVPYKANRGNIAQAWLILHNLDSWLCLPRRNCCRKI